jgi:hypothetical protein
VNFFIYSPNKCKELIIDDTITNELKERLGGYLQIYNDNTIKYNKLIISKKDGPYYFYLICTLMTMKR